MFLKILILTCLFFLFGSCEINDYCRNKMCLHKCCPPGQYVGRKFTKGFICKLYPKYLDFSSIQVFNEDGGATNISFDDTFGFSDHYFNETKEEAIDVQLLNFIPRLTENGVLLLELPNSYQRWTRVPVDKYCMDFKIGRNRLAPKQSPSVKYWAIMSYNEFSVSTQGYFYVAVIATVLFLLLTILVQIYVPELKVLYIPILMAYLACVVVSSSMLITLETSQHLHYVCIALTMSVYFFCLSTCCWMVVMSLDIWIASRYYRRSIAVNQDRKLIKFIIYGVFAVGLPLIMMIALFVLNTVDMSDLPWFVTPQVPNMGCFLDGGHKIYYLYIPMLILFMVHWIFCILTAFNIFFKAQMKPSSPGFQWPLRQ